MNAECRMSNVERDARCEIKGRKKRGGEGSESGRVSVGNFDNILKPIVHQRHSMGAGCIW